MQQLQITEVESSLTLLLMTNSSTWSSVEQVIVLLQSSIIAWSYIISIHEITHSQTEVISPQRRPQQSVYEIVPAHWMQELCTEVTQH